MAKVACLVQTYNGKSEEDYKAEHYQLFSIAKERYGATVTAGFDAINENDAPRAIYMLALGNNIRYMAMADVVVFGKDWKTSMMGRILHSMAVTFDMDFVECYSDWRDKETLDDNDQTTERTE